KEGVVRVTVDAGIISRGYGQQRLADGFLSFFFFQAEDGIRDLIVTGVQTCALPISIRRNGHDTGVAWRGAGTRTPAHTASVDHRSEERRVGKECRSRWAP